MENLIPYAHPPPNKRSSLSLPSKTLLLRKKPLPSGKPQNKNSRNNRHWLSGRAGARPPSGRVFNAQAKAGVAWGFGKGPQRGRHALGPVHAKVFLPSGCVGTYFYSSRVPQKLIRRVLRLTPSGREASPRAQFCYPAKLSLLP